MYYKYQYDKVNETLFIPIKPSILNSNSSFSVNFSYRIQSAKPKINTLCKASDTEQSTIGPSNLKITFDGVKPITTNFNDNLTSSMMISPTNEHFLVGTKSFVNENEWKESGSFQRKKKRVMSAKYERNCYLKIKDKSSFEEGSDSLGLFVNTYQPKQLTTDKCNFH